MSLSKFAKELTDDNLTARQLALQTLAGWTCDPAFESVRDPKRLAELPEAERKEWEAFWDEVRTLLPKK